MIDKSRKRLYVFSLIVLIICVMLTVVNFTIDRSAQLDQSAVCAVISKHLPHRYVGMYDGECLMLSGVEDRIIESVVKHGIDIMKNEADHD